MTTAPPTPEADRLTELGENECWLFLQSSALGRIALNGPEGIEVFPVNYRVADRSLVFRSAPGTKLSLLIGGAACVFEVDGIDGAYRWSVLVRGVARRLDAQDDIEASGVLLLQPDAPRSMWNFVRISPTRVTGRFFRSGRPAGAEDAHERDAALAGRVRHALAEDHDLDAMGVRVRVENGVITLSGEVAGFAERLRIRCVVLAVEGVEDLRDETVSSLNPADWALDDDDIRAAVAERLAGLELGDALQISVDSRVAVLEGRLPTNRLRQVVRHLVRTTPGVHFVDDHIVVDEATA